MQAFPIAMLTEAGLDSVIKAIGGARAHADATRSETIKADDLFVKTESS
jgi:hypothetical protein